MIYLNTMVLIIILVLFVTVAACAGDAGDTESAPPENRKADEASEKQDRGPLAPKPEQGTVRSADGTRIGFTKIGSGSAPLVVVHGALNSGEQWIPVATAMLSVALLCHGQVGPRRRFCSFLPMG